MFERALRDLAVYMLGNWDELIGYFQIMEGATTLRGTVNAQLAENEGGLAERAAAPRSNPGGAGLADPLLVGRATAAYRVWLHEMRTAAVSDPARPARDDLKAQT